MPTRKWGSEVLVNTTTTSVQYESSVTALKGGGYVIVWTDDGPTDSVTRYQIYDAGGNALGLEQTVNSGNVGDQTAPSVTALNNGGFYIVWRDYDDVSDQDIDGMYFGATGGSGTFLEPSISTANNLSAPVVASLGSGGFGSAGTVVAWVDGSVNGGDIRMLSYNAANTASIAEFTVNTNAGTLGSSQSQVALGLNTAGGYASIVVAWRDEGLNSGDIRARIFTDAGVETTAEFSVASSTSGNQTAPSVTWLNNTSFVIVWTDSSGLDGDGRSIQGRVFSYTGAPITAQFQINSTGQSDQTVPVVKSLPDGGFIVAWEDDSQVGLDSSGTAIRLQAFDGTGGRRGVETVVNTTSLSGQSDPALAVLGDGRVVVTWTDGSLTGGDTSSSAIRSQIIDPRDGIVMGTGLADTLYGHGSVADEISAGSGNDLVYAQGGDDSVYGAEGNDEMYGQAGLDLIFGGIGDDVLNGGAGDDVLRGEFGLDLLVGDTGDDVLFGGSGGDTLLGGLGSDFLYGEVGNDSLLGHEGDDILNGGTDNDALLGGVGNDSLLGGAGNDVLVGGAGGDRLEGGANIDVFKYEAPTDGGDLIVDFVHGTDALYFVGAAFGGFTPGSALANGSTFISSAAPAVTAAVPTFLYNSANGNLFFDIDGTGGQAAVFIAALQGAPGLTSGDFVFI